MRALTLIALATLAGAASAQNIYVMTSGNSTHDTNVVNLLTSQGMSATVGLSGTTLTTSENLSAYDAIYVVNNYNWASGFNSAAQQAVVNFVATGKGAVTNEWLNWANGSSGALTILDPILPATYGGNWRGTTAITLNQVTANAVINAGVASTFTYNPGNAAGAESMLVARAGATTYYGTDYGPTFAGLVGWNAGGGRVFSFSSVMGDEAVLDPNSGRLLANTFRAAAGVPEPATMAALGFGALALLRRRRR